jgi:hypothetical protein
MADGNHSGLCIIAGSGTSNLWLLFPITTVCKVIVLTPLNIMVYSYQYSENDNQCLEVAGTKIWQN